MFSSGFYLFIYLKKKKNELFRPCQGYSSYGLWLGRCLVIDFFRLHWCRWFRCCVSNLIIGSFHRLRLGFIFDEFRTLLTVCSYSQDPSTDFCITVQAPNTSLFSSSRAE